MKTLQELIAEEKAVEKRLRKNKKASNALKKAKRKLRKAIKADTLTSMRIALGMAQVALNKAEFCAKTLGGKI